MLICSMLAPARNSESVMVVSEFRAIANSSAVKLCCTRNHGHTKVSDQGRYEYAQPYERS